MATRRSPKTKTAKGTTSTTIPKGEYKIVKSVASDSLNYVSEKLSGIVTEQMVEGWIPHGTPLVLIEDEKYIMIQAMVNVTA